MASLKGPGAAQTSDGEKGLLGFFFFFMVIDANFPLHPRQALGSGLRLFMEDGTWE